jgi:hypothetical protein
MERAAGDDSEGEPMRDFCAICSRTQDEHENAEDFVSWDEMPEEGFTGPLSTHEINVLRERYQSVPTPTCRVCGGEMAIGSMGGGMPTVWHCASPEADWLGHGEKTYDSEPHPRYDHWQRSTVEQRIHGDSRVIRALDELQRARASTCG